MGQNKLFHKIFVYFLVISQPTPGVLKLLIRAPLTLILVNRASPNIEQTVGSAAEMVKALFLWQPSDHDRVI